MKKTIKVNVTLLLLLTLCTTATATDCAEREFVKGKIELFLCSNHGRIGEIGYLLFEARTKVLNDYIKNKIAKGKLENKKFRISIQDPIYMRTLFLGQNDTSYFVHMSGFPWPTLEQLISIVNYFAKPDWEPIDLFYWRRENETEEEFEKRIQAEEEKKSVLFGSTIEQIEYQPFIIWERDGVSLKYSGDSLKYVINGIPLPFKVNATLPVRIHDRFLFFETDFETESDYIHVVQNMEIIKTHRLDFFGPVSFNLGENYVILIDSEWVYICWHSNKDSCFYRYSYHENRFTEIKPSVGR